MRSDRPARRRHPSGRLVIDGRGCLVPDVGVGRHSAEEIDRGRNRPGRIGNRRGAGVVPHPIVRRDGSGCGLGAERGDGHLRDALTRVVAGAGPVRLPRIHRTGAGSLQDPDSAAERVVHREGADCGAVSCDRGGGVLEFAALRDERVIRCRARRVHRSVVRVRGRVGVLVGVSVPGRERA